jgi:pyruvate dehydrogenase E2 component (dihydrolipoamide acetyltransferase)
MATEFKLPELGENVESGTIARVLVSEGDEVSKGQSVLEVETDKAVVEVPSSEEGTISEVKVSDGDTVNVGDTILVLNGAGGGAKKKEAPKKEEKPKEEKAEKKEEAPKKEEKPKEEKAEKKESTKREAPKLQVLEREEKEEKQDSGAEKKPAGGAALASPAVRRLARELDVKLEDVPTSDPEGRITSEDVKTFVKGGSKPAAKRQQGGSKGTRDEDKWGPVSMEPMSAVRRKTASHMAHCWETIPHVTHFDKADITALESVRKKHGKKVEQAGGKLTVTSFLVKVITEALQRFPQFNASVDTDNEQIIYREYYNVGVAADTPNGLLVPVIKNADQKSITDVSLLLPELAKKARDRKLSLEDMQGGTFTISNLGGIGGIGFTPIINHPEVAILGVSRGSYEPVMENGQFAPRLMLPLSLSYDHRLIDGADAARFLRWVCETLEQPWTLFLED